MKPNTANCHVAWQVESPVLSGLQIKLAIIPEPGTENPIIRYK